MASDRHRKGSTTTMTTPNDKCSIVTMRGENGFVRAGCETHQSKTIYGAQSESEARGMYVCDLGLEWQFLVVHSHTATAAIADPTLVRAWLMAVIIDGYFDQIAYFDALIEASSLGTPGARELRNRTSDERAAKILKGLPPPSEGLLRRRKDNPKSEGMQVWRWRGNADFEPLDILRDGDTFTVTGKDGTKYVRTEGTL
jgi:hypothetical protein